MKPFSLLASFVAAALALTLHQQAQLPASEIGAAIFHYALLPRLCMALLCGAALALSGVILQQVLHNPLAEPATLGIAAGAQLALSLAVLMVPSLSGDARDAIALLGALACGALVCALAWRGRLAPLTLIMAGLLVSTLCGAGAAVLSLLHQRELQGIFIWSSGTLAQNDWSLVRHLAPRLLLALPAALLISRPLTLLGLHESQARSLGVGLLQVRLMALGLALLLAAWVTSAVGVIGFIGLLAPSLARLSGAHRLRQQLYWAPLLGAALLWLTDELVQGVAGRWSQLPTGSATALLGAPLLLWLLRRSHDLPAMPTIVSGSLAQRSTAWLGGILLVLASALFLSLFVGQGGDGWAVASAPLPWRWPRALAAASCGAMLGVAGALLQRNTGNPLASPELLGISSGAALGVIALLLSGLPQSRGAQLLAAACGATTTLLAIVLLARSSGFSPRRTLLVGVVLSTFSSALAALLLTRDDPRLGLLLDWLSGSTYLVNAATARSSLLACALLLLPLPLFSRWLAILPLGDTVGRALGLRLGRSRGLLLLLSAALTGAAALVVGPLSFVGLLAPQLARTSGLRRPLQHIAGAALLGALLMLLADWLGRNLLFPYEIPAGLLATVAGAPYLLWSLRRLP
jgi:iron complex transport system permease protein